jgi:hypothetical protein
MAEQFSGPWIVQVHSKEAAFSERFVITGSLASDGIYPGDVTTPPVAVDGQAWVIRFEWNDNAGSGWLPSDVRRTVAQYTLADGLVVFLGADDNLPPLRDLDYNDLVLRCRSTDPAVNPWSGSPNLPDFSLPRGWTKETGDSPHNPGLPGVGDRRI